jgi:hypothetical protein
LQYKQKNYSLDYQVATIDLEMKEKNGYLSAPLAFRYNFTSRKRITPYVQVGAYGSRLVLSRSDFSYDNSENDEAHILEDINSFNRRRKWDYGTHIGLGALYKFGPGHFSGHLAYYRSFSNISDASGRYSNPKLVTRFYHVDDDLYLHGLSLMFGYNLILNYKVLDK